MGTNNTNRDRFGEGFRGSSERPDNSQARLELARKQAMEALAKEQATEAILAGGNQDMSTYERAFAQVNKLEKKQREATRKVQENHKKNVDQVHRNTREKAKPIIEVTAKNAYEKTSSVRVHQEYKDENSRIEFDKTGKATSDSVIRLLSDFDHTGGVEVVNRSWFRRFIFGGGEQKEIVGEQQLRNILKGKSQSELNAIYGRITGDISGINIHKNNNFKIPKGSDYGVERPVSFVDLDRATKAKIERFQRELIEQADTLAVVTEGLTGVKGMRTGLVSIIDGRSDELAQKLQTPEGKKQLQKIIDTAPLDRRPDVVDRILSFLLRLGINVGVGSLAGAQSRFILENKSLAKPSTKNNGSLSMENLSVRQNIGKNGGSVVGSIDLAGLRAEANWNDPEARISARTLYFQNAKDKNKAAKELVDLIQLSGKKKDMASLQELSRMYLQSHQKLASHGLKGESLQDAQADNTFKYLARVEKLNGFTLKGAFAAAGLSGWGIGLMGSSVDNSGNFDAINPGAATLEAQILSNKISPEQKKSLLEQAKIHVRGNVWVDQNNKPLFYDGKMIPAHIDIQKNVDFAFHETFLDKQKVLIATPTSFHSSVSIESLDLNNLISNDTNEFIENNRADVATRMLENRKGLLAMQKAIRNNNYDNAEKRLLRYFGRNPKHPFSKMLIKEAIRLEKRDIQKEKKVFYDALLALSSGGERSRALGKEARNGVDVSTKVREYYKTTGLARAFAKQFGIGEKDVLNLVVQAGALNKNTINQLSTNTSHGFRAMVGYSQLSGFKAKDVVDSGKAQTIGNLVEVTGSTATKIRQQIRSQMTDADIKAIRSGNPQFKNLTNEAIKDIAVGGKIESYLSFEDGAECFNLGFRIQPGQKGISLGEGSTLGRGAVVGNFGAEIFNLGIGLGKEWKKEKPEEKSQPKPEPEEKPQPKPEPEPKPEPKPQPKPQPKPETEPKPDVPPAPIYPNTTPVADVGRPMPGGGGGDVSDVPQPTTGEVYIPPTTPSVASDNE